MVHGSCLNENRRPGNIKTLDSLKLNIFLCYSRRQDFLFEEAVGIVVGSRVKYGIGPVFEFV